MSLKFNNPLLNEFDVIFECVAGSHLYGTATPDSDIDLRGVFIPTAPYFYGFLHHIEQVEDKNNDVVFYDLRKFLNLCVQNNPSILELLFVPPQNVSVTSEAWETIVDHRDLFVSTKARWTFTGYAFSQLKRIRLHRDWLLHPPKCQPQRSDFGLPNDRKLVSPEQLNSFLELTDGGREIDQTSIEALELDLNAMQILQAEKAFLNANKQWAQYQNWRNTRNEKRAALEAQYGYDTKHASHLYRLLTEGEELLTTGHITLPRPDADKLMAIRNGQYTYDQLMGVLGDVEAHFEDLYKKSPLPHAAQSNKIDDLCQQLVKNSLTFSQRGV